MVAFRRMKFFGRLNRGDDRLRIFLRRRELGNRILGDHLLFLIAVENHRTILLSAVISLPVQRGWIVHRKKYLQQFAIADPVWIERDPYNLNMSGVAIAYLPVGGLAGASAHVTRLDVSHPSQPLKHGFNAPEASAPKNRCLLVCHGS